MCLIFLAKNVHPKYKLVLAGNRDEYYQRPTAPLHQWQNGIIAGKDLQAGGTWLGVAKGGKFAAITNFRAPVTDNHSFVSRGSLVTDFLTGHVDAGQYLQTVADSQMPFRGYNLICSDAGNSYFYSNIENRLLAIPDGIHGLSNAHLNTPWPKVEKGKQLFEKVVTQGELSTEALLKLLADKTNASDAQLPDTGVSLAWERLLSSIFIESEGYGTRCSSIILIDQQNRVQFIERSYENKRHNDIKFSV
jgi:uncharacterized protein with NRDE domain